MPHNLAKPAGSTILKTPVSLFFQEIYEVYLCCESFSNCCKKSHKSRPLVLSSGVSPSLVDEVGTASILAPWPCWTVDVARGWPLGDLLRCWWSDESSESEWELEADCDLRFRLFRGGGTLSALAELVGGGYSWWMEEMTGSFLTGPAPAGDPPFCDSSEGAGLKVTENVK